MSRDTRILEKADGNKEFASWLREVGERLEGSTYKTIIDGYGWLEWKPLYWLWKEGVTAETMVKVFNVRKQMPVNTNQMLLCFIDFLSSLEREKEICIESPTSPKKKKSIRAKLAAFLPSLRRRKKQNEKTS